jgi:predicted RNase H-like HicB family nuclease
MSARRVRLVAHYEVAGPDEPTWWAASDDLPGFTAVYPSLGELQREAEDAVRFHLEADDVEVDWATADDVPLWAYVHISFEQPGFVREDQVTRSASTISVGIVGSHGVPSPVEH